MSLILTRRYLFFVGYLAVSYLYASNINLQEKEADTGKKSYDFVDAK
jgi:hypothetical protein